MTDETPTVPGLILELCELPVPGTTSLEEWEEFIEKRQVILDQLSDPFPGPGVSDEVLCLLRQQCDAVSEATRNLGGERERVAQELTKLRRIRSRLQGSVLQTKPFRGNLNVTA